MGLRTTEAISKDKLYPSATVSLGREGAVVIKTSKGTVLAKLNLTDAEKKLLAEAWADFLPDPDPPPDPPPVDNAVKADFTFSPANPTTGQEVTFTSSSVCPDGPCTYQWRSEPSDLGTAATAKFTFKYTGDKVVSLKVTDADGDSDTVTKTVKVGAAVPPPPDPDDPTDPPEPPPPSDGPRKRGGHSGVGLYNTNDQNLTVPERMLGIRWVAEKDMKLGRFFSQFKAKGVTWDGHGTTCSGPGPGCYGAGNGILHARLCEVNADGTPNLNKVLVEETLDAKAHYARIKSQYSVGAISLFWFTECRGVPIVAGKEYAMVYRNVAGLKGLSATGNFFSTNSIDTHANVAGPHGRNTRDPNAPGAIGGMDPREAACWSTNGGGTWTWGHQVGHYWGSGDDDVRLPHYALQEEGQSRPTLTGQPWTAYRVTGNYKLHYTAKGSGTYTKAGGYAPQGSSVGTVTVRNDRTGQQASTGGLGAGLVKGSLGSAVAYTQGDPITLSHSGTVCSAQWDGYQNDIMGDSGFRTDGNGMDRAQIFAE